MTIGQEKESSAARGPDHFHLTIEPESTTRREILDVILDLALTPLNEINLEHLLTDLCAGTAEALGFSGVAVYLFDDRTKSVRLSATSDAATWELLHEPNALDLANRAAGDLEPVVLHNTSIAGGRVGSTAVLPMRWNENSLGCLQLFTYARVLRHEDIKTADTVGTALAMLLFNSRNYQISTQMVMQLSSALQSRLPIEQAKGRLVERHHVDLGEAYRMLRSHARRNRISIREAADAVVNGAGVSVAKETAGRTMRRMHRPLPG